MSKRTSAGLFEKFLFNLMLVFQLVVKLNAESYYDFCKII